MAKQILVVDDESTLCEMLKESLSDEGYGVSTALSVPAAWEKLDETDFDLIVLDIMMPGENGFDLLRRYRRERGQETPVMLLTGVSAEVERFELVVLGADDYVVKPFSLPEFKARIKAVLRRYESNIPNEIKFGNVVINRAARTVMKDGEEVNLRLKEYQILTKLAESPGVAISRDDLFNAIWGDDSPSGEKTVDVTIHTLREKIEESPADPQYIQTVRGFGYRFRAPEASA
ncbi:MAG TPA: response regulator transcription factor [Firmicutes bacterium]|nr:response regulator transcription factor [Bacillota bacterium]